MVVPGLRRAVLAGGVGLATIVASLLPGGLNPPVGATEPASTAREFTLTAAPVEWEIQPGLVVQGWGYNGQVPGPELRVGEGDLVRVRLQNRLAVPTTLHWHGIDVPLEMDGVPGVSQAPVQPGEDFTYEFTATNPGTRWYHSHVDSNAQLELGLYGALIVEPREPEATVYDREFTYLLDEKALDFTPQVAMGQAPLRAAEGGNGRGGLLQYDLFLINGKAGDAIPPLQIDRDARIRLRLVNAGNLVHAMHLHGHSFSVIATDGNPVPRGQQLLKDTILIGPGERYDLEIRGTNPGVWMFHCHMPNHQDNGMMTTLVYAGLAPPAPDHAASIAPHSAHPTPPAVLSAPSPTAQPQPAPVAPDSPMVSMTDNRFVPATVTIPVGATVAWSNTGLNLHTATAFDGSFETGSIGSGATARVTFDRVGTFRYYCRQHLLGGMSGVIQVVATSGSVPPPRASL